MKTLQQATEAFTQTLTKEQAIAKTESESMKKPQSEECSGQKTPISNDLEAKKKLTMLVKSCYEALNTYGKSPENLEATIMLMQMALGRFDYEAIREAFGIYLQTNSDMPKPADIIMILEPHRKPKTWCATTFIDIKRRKREGQFVTRDEEKYCSDFLSAKTKEPDNAGIIDDALRQVERENKQYWLE